MAYTMSVSLVSPAHAAENQVLNIPLELSYTGDVLPWEFWVNDELKGSYPQGNHWRLEVNPTELGLPDGFWQQGTEYSWYVRYATDAATKTWVTDHWEYTGLEYTETPTRTFTTGIVTKISPVHNSSVTSGDVVTLQWSDTGVGATKYSWILVYNHPLYGESFIGGIATETSKEITSSIVSIFNTGASECAWRLRPYIGSYIDDRQGDWTIYINSSLPSKPVNPTPANNATEIDFSAFLLAWEDGGDADTYDVYIGSTGDLTLVSSAQANTGYLTTLEELETIFSASPINQKIYWRVDATNDDGTTTGDEWNFDPRPAKASNPSPEDEYTPMTLDWQLFSWDAVDNADTYNVYMGTEVGETPWSENMELIVDSSPLSYIVQSYLATATKLVYPYTGLAVYNYQYYWRVDAKNIFGETTGDSWSLTTITFDPPVSSYRGDFSGVEGIDWNWDGKNNMVIVKRLVAAAKDALYYEVI